MSDAVGDVKWETLTEGKAKILHRPGEAFYNPAQVQNRDLSIAVLREYHQLCLREAAAKAEAGKAPTPVSNPGDNGMRVLEGLSATGLRAVRYALEVPGIKEVVANDVSEAAVDSIRRNAAHNGVEALVTPSHNDASMVMYQHRGGKTSGPRFQVVDLDPYGTAAPFLDAAVQSVEDGGLLCVTCTDLAVLCGNNTEACYAKYGSTSLRGKHCHEFALRIVMSCIEQHANRYKRHAVPLLCVHMDFYVRLFVRVHTSALQVKKSASKRSLVYQCTGCGTFTFQPVGKVVEKGPSVKYLPGLGPPVRDTCEHCGGKHQLGGPIWTEGLQDGAFVEAVRAGLAEGGPAAESLASAKRLAGLLAALASELPDQPLFMELSSMASCLNVSCPSNVVLESAVRHSGFRMSHSHTCPTAIKTDAPAAVLWGILRGWAALHPPKTPKPGSPAAALLAPGAPDPPPNFAPHPEAQARVAARDAAGPRYLPNPTAEWGPKQRAAGRAADGGGEGGVSLRDRSLRNQGKNIGRKRGRDGSAAVTEVVTEAVTAVAAGAGEAEEAASEENSTKV